MTLSRRSTIKAIGVVGAGSTLAGTALAVTQDDEQDADETPADEEIGAIRVGHFVPDAPNVDVYVDDRQILSDVGYAELSPYLEIVPGTYSIAITPAGYDDPIYEGTIAVGSEFYTAAAVGEFEGESAPPESGDDTGLGGAGNESTANESSALADGSNGFENGTATGNESVANESDGDGGNETAANESATGTGIDADEGFDSSGFDVLLLVDSQTDDAEEGTSPLRLVHAVPDAPTIDIADGDTGAVIFEDVGFTEPSGYVPVEPGTQTLELFPTDEDDLDGGSESDEGSDANVTDAGDGDANGTDTDDGNATDTDIGIEVISQPDPVATVELELEADTAYTAYVIGYLEESDDTELTADESEDSTDGEGDGETDRSFNVYVAVDGEMSDETETDDESTENESTTDELKSDDGTNRTDESAANESATADH